MLISTWNWCLVWTILCAFRHRLHKVLSRELQDGYPERKSYNPHQEAYQHGSLRTYGSDLTAKYATLFIARPNKTIVNPCKQNVY